MAGIRRNPYVGEGIYTVSEAARISRISRLKIYRWLYGGSVTRETGGAVLRHQFKTMEDRASISFKDLIQLRFVDFFRSNGVSLQAIRKATAQASRLFDSLHPFCTAKFKTDGVLLLAEIEELDGRVTMVELESMQQVFKDVISPFLKRLEYEDEIVNRWWPLGLRGNIVIDPARNFGQPTLANQGVPTHAIYDAYTACDRQVKTVAEWHEITLKAVKEAVGYEESLAA